MLSKPKSKGLTRLKPLLILPLALVLVLAFAESRTVVQSDQGAEKGAVKSESAVQKVSEEELKAKFLKLEQMKDENIKKTALLKEKLASTDDPDTQAKIKTLLKEQKYMAMEIEVKGMSLLMAKAELGMTKETNAEKKAELKAKLAEMKAKEELLMKQLVEAREANGKENKEKK